MEPNRFMIAFYRQGPTPPTSTKTETDNALPRSSRCKENAKRWL